MATQTYGAALPDSEVLVNARAENLLGLLPTIASFVSYRASLEKDYAKKLSESTAKARLQAIKEGAERSGTGNKGTNTLEAGWMQVLEAADLDAREHLSLGEKLQGQVADALQAAGARLEGVRKKHHHFATKLLNEKDRANGEREKSKQKYFDACESLESARQKKGQAKDDRQADKAKRAFDLATDDMHSAKNQYLLDIDSYNVHKSRLYNLDLPTLHDDFQLLESSVLSTLVHLLLKGTAIDSSSLEGLREHVELAEEGLRGVSADEDQRLFVEAHSGAKLQSWEVPPDEVFEECPVWHDTPEMSTTPSSITYLQNVKIKALTRLSEITPMIDSKRREVSGLRNLRDAYEKDRSLGDAGAVMDNLLESSRDTTLLEIQQNELKAQVEMINATLGDDNSANLTLHDFKSSSFVTPASCVVCDGSIWGKGLSCRACGVACHAKCELKVPPGCSKTSGVGRSGSKRSSVSAARTTGSPSISSMSSVASPTTTSSSSFAPPPSRAPPAQATPAQSGTMLYEYSAQTAFEITVQEGEVVTIVAPEDEAGWTKVSTRDGRTGLVPASYIQIGQATSAPAQNSAQEVEAIYDYEAQSVDELSVAVGERLYLTEVGMEAGDGWAEATKGGRTGLIPSSYIQVV